MAAGSSAEDGLLATIRGLAVDQVAGQVIAALKRAGVRAILLKGASVARTLYGDGHARPYGDVDLLVAPEQLQLANAVLTDLGYAPRHAASSPSEHTDHAMEWDQPGKPTIDLHQSLEGVRATPHRCWARLSSQTRDLAVGGTEVEVLTSPGLAFNLALHASAGGVARSGGHQGAKRAKALNDLARALRTLDGNVWQEACDIARDLDALAAFGVGLRLDLTGRELADDLGLATDVSVELALRASAANVLALPFERLATTPGWRAKTIIIGRELVPTAQFLRHWWPPAERDARWLAFGYLYRAGWVMTHAPKGLRSWLRARRVVARARSVRPT